MEEKNDMQRCMVLDSAYLICTQMFCKSTGSPSGNLSSFEEKGVTAACLSHLLCFLYPQIAEHFTQNGFVNGRVICILSSYFNSIITAVCSSEMGQLCMA